MLNGAPVQQEVSAQVKGLHQQKEFGYDPIQFWLIITSAKITAALKNQNLFNIELTPIGYTARFR
jgi:hypothetical protein